MQKDYIGVFDSGLGGISVLAELIKVLPYENFLYLGDSKNAPYGEKTREDLIDKCLSIVDYFKDFEFEGGRVKAVVVACNTATSAAINVMRDKYDFPIIGIEPALKPACHGKENQNVLVMATPFTLKERKFNMLMLKYEEKNNIIKLPCPKLVEIIENSELDNKNLVEETIKNYFDSMDMKVSELDSIVLGCTHFIFYRNYIEEILSKNTIIIDGNKGTALHLKDVLEKNHILTEDNEKGKIEILNTSKNEELLKLSWRLLEKLE